MSYAPGLWRPTLEDENGKPLAGFGLLAKPTRLGAGDALCRNPTTGIAGCCARAASGHAAAAPPRAKMNSRRNFLRQKSNTY